MTSRFRRTDSAGRSGRGAGSGGGGPLVCPSCGLRNDPSARFCRNCGLPLGWPEDPVRGTTTRHADLPSERGAGVASIIGLFAAVAVLVVAGYLVLKGSSVGGAPSPSHTATPSRAAASPSGLASALPSGVLPSGSPLASPTAGITDTPSQPVTEPPGTFPATVGFTCHPATIEDPAQRRWKVTHVTWKAMAGYDSVIMDISNQGSATRSGSISLESVTLDEVSARFGLNAPQNAERAVVVTFEARVNGFKQSPVNTGMKVIPNLAMDQGSDGLWHVVLGAIGNGCQRIGVAAWNTDPTATVAQLVIDVQK